MLRRFFGRLFQLLGIVGLPGDVRIWWNILTPAVPTALTGLWAYAQQTSVPVLVLLGLAAYVVSLLASIPITGAVSRWRADSERQADEAQVPTSESAHRPQTIQAGSVGNIGSVAGDLHISITHSYQGDEPPDEDEPDDELNYENRSHFDDEGIYLPLFTTEDIYVRDKTFTNCRIYGPALIVPSLPSTYHDTFAKNCTFDADEPENFLWVATEDATGYIGLTVLQGCVFENCDFFRIGLVVKEVDYETWVEGLRARWRELEEGSNETTELDPSDEEPASQ